jgi:hypothetical protein
MYVCFPACPYRKHKTVANLSNNKDVFMCILRFHARAGYLQHYETLLKELNTHSSSDPIPPDQYEVLFLTKFEYAIRVWH